ncbi:hypothetical protein Pmani_036985 [Petrolisthes manimaculis]|uniref:Uncharacterized protein n=1 Tax=Petrolisthes manimaculis TaxID=1843537 RepID=A0AAE1NIM6_9EUCA|nr:hypothetical protein Pmani_036985 [Petrolisthes manimaculis]
MECQVGRGGGGEEVALRRYQTAIIGRSLDIKLRPIVIATPSPPSTLPSHPAPRTLIGPDRSRDKSGKIRVKNRDPLPAYPMEHQEDMEEEGRVACVKSENSNGGGVVSMEEEEEDMGGGGDGIGGGGGGGGGGGRDSPLKPDMSMVEGEDILAKLREQVSSATTNLLPLPPTTHSPSLLHHHHHHHHHNNNNFNNNNNNNNNNVHSLYDRLHTLLQAKKKTEEEGEGDEDSRDLVFRAEVLQRQRESLLSSPQALMNAVRAGGPPSLVPPSPHPHLPFIPATVGLPPTTAQMPPTPGSAGSKDSSGNGGRTPSHTPEPHHSHQSWSFEEQFKQV